tara:strand:+ start:339 stop:1844 length:1506 start_codon:yes stop_codon:yes gene_type:complete
MSIPQALMTGVDNNESQDLLIETDVLEPNVLNRSQAVFVIPKKGTVLDSKSALKMRVNWEGYADATNTDVGGKLFSGLLGMIKNTRLYASGQLISRLDNAGEKIHLDRQFNDQEYKEQYDDTKHGSSQGFYVADGIAQSGVNGAIINSDENGGERSNASPPVISGSKYTFRGVGKSADRNGLEMFVVLDELFPMLKDFPLPVRFLKDEIRIEIDWEQDKSKWLYVAGTAVTDNLASISIDSVVLFLDYLTYNQELDNETKERINGPGISIPFRQTAVITKVMPGSATAQTDLTEDVLLGQEGRAVMKIFVAKKYPNALTGLTGGLNQGNVFQGSCRSEALLNQKYNFVVNDLLVYDRNVQSLKESYAYFSYTGEKPGTCYPEAWNYNNTYGAQTTNTDVLYSTNDGNTADQVILGRAPAVGMVQSGIKGQQNWDSVDLAKFGSKLNPQNAMRIGATPIIYRNVRDVTAGDVRTGGAVSLTIFVEYLRLFDLRGGDLSVRDL